MPNIPLIRRDFLRLSFGLGVASVGAIAATGGAQSEGGEAAGKTVPDDGLQVREIAPGIHVHSGQHALTDDTNDGDLANLAIIIGSTAAAVVDTGGSAAVGRRLRTTVASLTDVPLRYVINTHMHPDHVLGNAAFRDTEAVFVGHEKLPQALAARRDFYLRRAADQLRPEAFAGTDIIAPTLLVGDRSELDLGGRKLILKARPTAHTDNDLTIRDDATDTWLLGDLLFAEHVPTLDGSVIGWLALIDELKKESAARVVPGHGPSAMSWPDAIAPLQAYWRAIVDGVRAAIEDGQSLGEATKTVAQSERDKWKVFDEHHIRNVGAVYSELEWE